MSEPFDKQEFLSRLMRGEVREADLFNLVTAGHALVERRKNAAIRRANRIDKAITDLKREMIEHCRNPHGHGRHAELIRFDLTVLLAERDRLSRAVPTLDDELLEQLADDYDASDARKAAAKARAPLTEEAAREDFRIELPDDADPAAVAETIKAALGGEVGE